MTKCKDYGLKCLKCPHWNHWTNFCTKWKITTSTSGDGMTEKQFKFNGRTNCIEYDNESILLDSYGEDIEELLNEQHETIQRLKQNIDELLSVNVEEELLKENEQLKQSFKEILKDLEVSTFNKELLEKENDELKKILYDTVSQLDAEISVDYSVYSVRVVVDSVMFHRIKEICR